jgi:hypothetical protein
MKNSASNILEVPCMDQVFTLWSVLTVDVEKAHIRFICMIACLASLTVTPSPWLGPVSQAFLAFNSMVMEVSRNLRNLVEMTVLAMCVHGDVDRVSRKALDWTKLGMMYVTLFLPY